MKHFAELFDLRLVMLRNTVARLASRSRFELITLILFFLGGACFLYFFFLQGFRFFREQEPFGPILVDEVFYLFTFVLFLMLFVSSAVSAYSSLFRSPDVPFLATRPVDWNEIYFIKLTEIIWLSSWSFLFVAVPFMAAYGVTRNAGPVFALECFAFFIPYVLLAGILGTLFSTLIIGLLPSRKRRRIFILTIVAAVVAAGFYIQPQAVREQGSIAGIMSGYLPHITFAKNPFFPSCWVTRGILSLSNFAAADEAAFRDGIFYLGLLVSNMLFFLIPSYSLATRVYPRLYLRLQDFAESETLRRIHSRGLFEKCLDRLRWPGKPVMAFLEKDLKTFARDPAEWSQMIIFFGLLFVYFINLKNLEFHILKEFWKNLVFVLNTVGTYIVLASFNMRLVFPMISLEGSRFWIINLSPIRASSLLLEKFFLGTAASTLLTLPLVLLSGWMLEMPLERIAFTAGLGFFVCVALTGMSVGMGTLFPNFKSTNPSEIISGFGGSLLLVLHLSYLGLIGLFLILNRDTNFLILFTVASGSVLAGMVPIGLAVKRLRTMEF